MDFKSLGWKFLTKETFGDGKLVLYLNYFTFTHSPYTHSPTFPDIGFQKKKKTEKIVCHSNDAAINVNRLHHNAYTNRTFFV